MATISKRPGRDGTPHYQVRIRLRGGPHQTASFPTLAAARRWAQTLEGAIRTQRAFPTPEAARHTLADLLDRYQTEVLSTKHPATARKQGAHVLWWRQQLGPRLLVDVTPARLAACRDQLAHHRTPATVTGYLATVSHALTIAVTEWQWLEESPMRRVRRPRQPPGRVRYLTEEERPRLLYACQRSHNRWLYPVVLLALATGARKMEILQLTWSDVDLPRARLIIHHTKNRERRALPLTGLALEAVQQLAKVRRIDTPLLFPRADGRGPVDLRAAWTTALEAAAIADFRFHDLRHSAASYLAMTGASLMEIAAILGHKTLAMVQRYAHLSEAHTATVVARMNAAIFDRRT